MVVPRRVGTRRGCGPKRERGPNPEKGWARRVGAKISRFFFFFPLSRYNFHSFLPSLGLLVELWWCLKRRDPRMCMKIRRLRVRRTGVWRSRSQAEGWSRGGGVRKRGSGRGSPEGVKDSKNDAQHQNLSSEGGRRSGWGRPGLGRSGSLGGAGMAQVGAQQVHKPVQLKLSWSNCVWPNFVWPNLVWPKLVLAKVGLAKVGFGQSWFGQKLAKWFG